MLESASLLESSNKPSLISMQEVIPISFKSIPNSIRGTGAKCEFFKYISLSFKSDFNKLSQDENVNIEKIKLKNQNDDKILKKEIIKQIYAYSENKIIVVNDLNLSENFLIYIDKIENVSINNNSEDYQKYLDLSRIRIVNALYTTYDNYIKKRYEIDINYQALNTVKNYFN